MVKPTTSSPSPSPPPSASHSTTHKYTGVRKRKWGKWVSEIRLPNSRERIWLGSFDTPKKAARAFDAAQFCLRGLSANFNFPHDPPNIAGGRNLTRLEIRKAAKEFANNYNSDGDEEEAVAEAVEQMAIVDDNESNGSPSSLSNSFSAASDGTIVQLDNNYNSYNNNNNNNDVGSLFNPLTTMGSGNYASDFGLLSEEFSHYYAPHSPYLNFGNDGNGGDNGDYSGSGGGGDNWNESDQYHCSYLWNF